MAAISVRDLDDDVRDRLRRRAARHGRSMEAEIRAILTEAVQEPVQTDFAREWHRAFAEVGGVELDLPGRDSPARGVDFTT